MFCTNCGASLPGQARFCNQCGQMVQALQNAGFELIPGEFEHPSMQQMNQTLRRSLVLNRMAESISQKVGKPWYESCFNSVQVTEKQYGRVFELAKVAAQRIGFTQVPSVYIEADRGYQSNTYGSEKDAFVNIGTFLPKLLNDRELLFILGHEFGHLKCRHALWMTVSMFLVGQARGNLMSQGILSYVSNPLKIIESGVESVIANWMRVADLTADRAALLVAGDIAVARRTLFLLYFKSRKELDEVDVDEWAKQQEAQASTIGKVSQLMTSSTPYLGLRLRSLEEFYTSPRYVDLRNRVEAGSGLDLAALFDEKGNLKKFVKPAKGPEAPAGQPAGAPGRPGEAAKASSGSKPGGTAKVPVPDKPAARKIKVVEGECPNCGRRFALPLASLPEKPAAVIRCKGCQKSFRVNLSSVRNQDPARN